MSDRQSYIPNLYGRRQDKPLKRRQAQLMENMLPGVAFRDPETNPRNCVADLQAMFPAAKNYALEVGFGGGEHLAWQARENPQTGFIGAEPFINGVGKLLSAMEDGDLGNIRVHHGDARVLMEALPENALARIFVLHPDPWPKKRHHKRRMISPWFFAQATRLLQDHGELRVASDIPDYIRWTLMHAHGARELEWQAQAVADWSQRPDDWPQTRYEAKAIREGRVPTYLSFRRLPR